jgi:hypothetical protein
MGGPEYRREGCRIQLGEDSLSFIDLSCEKLTPGDKVTGMCCIECIAMLFQG